MRISCWRTFANWKLTINQKHLSVPLFVKWLVYAGHVMSNEFLEESEIRFFSS